MAAQIVETFTSLNRSACNLQDFGTTSSSILALHSWDSSGLSRLPHISLVPGSPHMLLSSQSFLVLYCAQLVTNHI